jgi:hypothetical protein
MRGERVLVRSWLDIDLDESVVIERVPIRT